MGHIHRVYYTHNELLGKLFRQDNLVWVNPSFFFHFTITTADDDEHEPWTMNSCYAFRTKKMLELKKKKYTKIKTRENVCEISRFCSSLANLIKDSIEKNIHKFIENVKQLYHIYSLWHFVFSVVCSWLLFHHYSAIELYALYLRYLCAIFNLH